MTRRLSILFLSLTLFGLCAGAQRDAGAQSAPAVHPDPHPLSLDEVRALADRAIASQHRDDQAIVEYERIEHNVLRTSLQGHIIEDKLSRVVPNGNGTLKLVLKNDGRPVSPEDYLRDLQIWEHTLELALNKDDPRTKASNEKFEKKQKERAEMVSAAREAFHATWLGRETRNGRSCVKLFLEPNSDFQPHGRLAEMLTHARATIWIDEASGHLVRGDAEIIRDISFGGGILGKVYRGGRFQLEQSEVAPGVWLPTHYQYDFMGRKFLFTFEMHDYTEISHYRKLGSTSDALAVAHLEIQNKKQIPGDP